MKYLPLFTLLTTLFNAYTSAQASFVNHYDIDWSSLKTPAPPRYLPRPYAGTKTRRATSVSSPANTTVTLVFTCTVDDVSTTITADAIATAPDLPTTADTICKKAHATFLRAISRIASVIYLKEQITISAGFSSFCAGQKPACRASQGTLGSAGPAGWHEWNATAAAQLGLDSNYLYPTALARQHAPLDLADIEYDIAASFNSEPLWWFPTVEDPIGDPDSPSMDAEKQWSLQWGNRSDPPLALRGVMYDFEQIVLHELLHGLGFISSWYPYLTETSILPAAPLIDSLGTVVGLSKPYLFNKWMAHIANRTWMSTYETQILTYGRDVSARMANGTLATRPGTWQHAFQQTPAYTIATDLFTSAATKSGAVAFYYPRLRITRDPTAPPLELRYAVLFTSREYEPGSTFSHSDASTHKGTRNFLMRPYGTAGVGLDGVVPRGEPIGEVVQGVLGALGYATSMFLVAN
ncbi:hypothetical protein HDU86_001904 [Geranomyces michiganensis]|nr:hypothetical protein HDU86_001904 [Geranomyces michiganensis]